MRGATGALAIVLASMACAGCPQMAILTGASMVAGAAADDRSLEQQAADLDLKAVVERALLDANPTVAGQVNVDVYLGRVMLTGVVGDWGVRRGVLDVARRAAPGREIYDDLEVAAGGGIADAATNLAVDKDLGVRLLADEGLASQSFLHRVVNGAAFIMGQADEPWQIARARDVALGTPGIARVVTHIELRP
jgi:osmotically-inducible protein OsmY